MNLVEPIADVADVESVELCHGRCQALRNLTMQPQAGCHSAEPVQPRELRRPGCPIHYHERSSEPLIGTAGCSYGRGRKTRSSDGALHDRLFVSETRVR